MNYHPIVWGVIPTKNCDMFIEKPKEKFPHYGSIKERNFATKLFNQYSYDLCKQHDICFLSIFDYLINEDGSTKSEYYIDQIHLSKKAMPLIMKELEKVYLSHIERYPNDEENIRQLKPLQERIETYEKNDRK